MTTTRQPAPITPGLGRRVRATLRMLLPFLRVVVRHARSRHSHRSVEASSWTYRADGRVVELRPGGTAPVTVDGRIVGTADVRHDHGSSTLEMWSAIDDVESASTVGDAVHALAREVGAHRLAWSLRPGSVEHRAAPGLGMAREGRVTEPLGMAGVPHDLWATLLD